MWVHFVVGSQAHELTRRRSSLNTPDGYHHDPDTTLRGICASKNRRERASRPTRTCHHRFCSGLLSAHAFHDSRRPSFKLTVGPRRAALSGRLVP